MPKKKTHGQFISEVLEQVGEEYAVLGEYTRVAKPVEMKHNICGHEYMVTPNNFKKGRRCPRCNRNYPLEPEQFKEIVSRVLGEDYVLLTDYVTQTKRIHVLHTACGHKYTSLPNNLRSGRRCPKCYRDYLKTTEEFKREVYELVGDEYEVVGEYVGNKRKIRIVHTSCNYKYESSPINFIRGNRCPSCSSNIKSRGESSIQKLLDRLNVKYIREYTFPDCRDKHVLPFDFAVLSPQGNLQGVIEYDGIQHFKPTYGEESYQLTIRHDKIKTNYCEEKEIPLLRIPYTEYANLEKIIKNHIVMEGC